MYCRPSDRGVANKRGILIFFPLPPTGGVQGEVHRGAVRRGVWGARAGAERGDEHVRGGEGADEDEVVVVDDQAGAESPQDGNGGRGPRRRRDRRRPRAVAEGAGGVVRGDGGGRRHQDERRERRQSRLAPDALAAGPRFAGAPETSPSMRPGIYQSIYLFNTQCARRKVRVEVERASVHACAFSENAP